jgi:N-acetylneuraminic acid mutarotase
MKRINIFNMSSILVLILVLLLSTPPAAFAATTTDTWVTKASMTTPRNGFHSEVVSGKIYAIGGNSDSIHLSSVEEYDPIANIWTMKASMAASRLNFQTAVINGKIYAIGGLDGSYLSSVEEYDPEADTWSAKASMSTARAIFQIEVINGKIYAIGGSNNSGYLSSVEEFDPTSNTWTIKAPMSTTKCNFQTEVIDGKIYAIGGANSDTLSSMEVYDPVSDTWTTKASMSSPRTWFQTEVIDGKIYAIGGVNSNILSSMEIYDPASDTWSANASMSTPRCNFQTEVVNGKIYALGGYENASAPAASALATFEEYEPTTDTWTVKTSMSTPRYWFQTKVIDGKIYAIGGNSSGSIEEYTAAEPAPIDPTLTVTASSNKVKVGQQFTTAVAIHNGTNICAEDIKITYDTDLFTYSGAEAQTGLNIYKEDTSVPGTIRFISACEGKDNAATGDKDLITLKFTAKKEGIGKVDIIKGRIADNATLEEDVTDENCGEDSITVSGYADVNKTGDFTLLDLGIDGWYNGMNAVDTDTVNFNADVVEDGIIDDNDLLAITQGILSNSNYQPNT